MTREQEIKEIAYRLWEDEGRPDGKDFDHYLQAEQIWAGQQDGNGAEAKATTTRTRRATATRATARKSVKKAS